MFYKLKKIDFNYPNKILSAHLFCELNEIEIENNFINIFSTGNNYINIKNILIKLENQNIEFINFY